MKKLLNIVILFSIVFIMIFINSCQKSNEENKFKIGADFSLSGNLAYWSLELKKGMDFAKTEVDKSNKLQIIYEDNKGKASDAVNIFKKLATVDNVNVLITCFTPIGQPLRDLAFTYKTPLVATVTSAHNFAAINDWTFRDFPTQDQQASALAKYVFETMKLKKGSYLIVNDDYGKDGAKIFKETFNKLGGQFLEGEYFTQTDLNMRNQINKVLKNKPEFLLIIGRDQALATVCKQIREVNKDVKIVGVNAFDASIVWESIGDAGEGIVFTSAFVDYENNPNAKKFKDDFFKVHNEIPSYVAVYGYTITKYLFEKVGSDNQKIKNELERLNVSSIRGELKINGVRDIISPIGIYLRKEGKTNLLVKAE